MRIAMHVMTRDELLGALPSGTGKDDGEGAAATGLRWTSLTHLELLGDGKGS